MEVSLSVYDVTNTASDNTNTTIVRLNNATRGLGFGVFHGAVALNGVEWSFGYCEDGTGVYCCYAGKNSLYTFRESLPLGQTSKSKGEIRAILDRLKREWPGYSYDLLARNCCHFCEVLSQELGVPPPPAWLNRLAQGADATVKFTNEASAMAKRVSTNISVTATQSATWLREQYTRLLTAPADGSEASGDGTPTHSPAGSHQTEQGAQVESAAGMASLANRLRMLRPANAATATQPSGSGSSGSPAETGLMPSLNALRQYISADGTKQFLFGLVRTRQDKTGDDDDFDDAFGGGGRGGGHGGTGSPGGAPSGSATRQDSCTSDPTRPPVPQVISALPAADVDVVTNPMAPPPPPPRMPVSHAASATGGKHLLDL